MNNIYRKNTHFAALSLVAALMSWTVAIADDDDEAAVVHKSEEHETAAHHETPAHGVSDVGHEGGHGLHFSRPLVSRSPSPVTEVITGYSLENLIHHEGEMAVYKIEGEYAFNRWLTAEIVIPYAFLEPEVGHGDKAENIETVEIGLKYASFAFEDSGVILGGGLEFGLPTGDHHKGIGSDDVLEVAPYVDFGWQAGDLQVVGFMKFGIVTSTSDPDEPDWELIWNLSTLYPLTPWLNTVVELDGERIHGGHDDGLNLVSATTGFKIKPFSESSFEIGAGVRFPISNHREYQSMSLVSFFYHF